MTECLRIVVLGRSLTSSKDNPSLGAYRSLLREVYALGHDILYLEPQKVGVHQDKDLARHYFCNLEQYRVLDDLRTRFATDIAGADVVIVTSGLDRGKQIAELVTECAGGCVVFHDLDTPRTLAALAEDECPYLDSSLIERFDLYLASSAGPSIDVLRETHGVRSVMTLYAAFDQEIFYPQNLDCRWDLGYRGPCRQEESASLEEMLICPARMCPELEFSLSGYDYLRGENWPSNLTVLPAVGRAEQRRHYNAHRFFLFLAPAFREQYGFSPSARMFEAAACGVPVIAEAVPGVECFLEPGKEVLLARSGDEIARILRKTSDEQRGGIGGAARERVLREHSVALRAQQLESVLGATLAARKPKAYML